MTGRDLDRLRWGACMGSTRRLAARLGIHPSTVRRGVRRRLVTPYVRARVMSTPALVAHLRGMYQGDRDRRAP